MKHVIKIDFFRFCIVGAFGFVLNFALLTLFYKLLNINIYISQLFAGEVALFANFLLHHNWTYKNNTTTKKLTTILTQFHLTSWAAVIGTSLIVGSLVTHLHLNYIVALGIGGLIGLFWNFIWTKFVIWKNDRKPPNIIKNT